MKKIIITLLVLVVNTLKAQVINFPDPAFKAILLQADTNNNIGGGVKIDANSDGEITQSEALAVYYSSIQTPGNITDISGIEYFTNVQTIQLISNTLQTADLTSLTNLESLDLGANQLTSINLNGLTNLWFINISSNQLTSVDFSTLSALKILIISFNQLTQLDFSNNPLFEQLRCPDNPNLNWVNIRNNRSQVYSFTPFNGCWGNCPNLTTICVDDNEVTPTQNFLAGCGITQPITVTTNCALSIEEQVAENVSLFPNPSADGMFTLLFNQEIKEGTVEVYNLLGQKVKQEKLDNVKEYLLDLKSTPTGTYMLRIHDGEQELVKRIMIK